MGLVPGIRLGLTDADARGQQLGPGRGFCELLGVTRSATPRCTRHAGAVGAGRGVAAATCPGVGGSLGGSARLSSPLRSGTLLSPPQEALFVKLGRLGRRRLHVLTWRIEPFSVLGGRASGVLALQDNAGQGWCREQGSETLQRWLFTCEPRQASRLPIAGERSPFDVPHVSGGKVPSYLPPREGGTCDLAWVRSPPASGGPDGFRLCAERAKVLSLRLKNPPEPGLAPFVSNLTGWGWPE